MTDRKGMEEQLKRLALHDPLTLLANRSLFRDRLEHAVAVSKRNGRGVAVMFVDLDEFKEINYGHGHLVGDDVLQVGSGLAAVAAVDGQLLPALRGPQGS